MAVGGGAVLEKETRALEVAAGGGGSAVVIR
jgi:hypothetical protein